MTPSTVSRRGIWSILPTPVPSRASQYSPLSAPGKVIVTVLAVASMLLTKRGLVIVVFVLPLRVALKSRAEVIVPG